MSKIEPAPPQQQQDDLPADITQMILEAHRKLKMMSKAFPVDPEGKTKLEIMFSKSLIGSHNKEP